MMTRLKLMVEFLLITTGANLICSGEISGNGRQSIAVQQPVGFLPSSHLVNTTRTHSQRESSFGEFSERTGQMGRQPTHSIPEAKMVLPAKLMPSAKKAAVYMQAKATIVSKATTRNAMYATDQAPTSTVVKPTIAAKPVREVEPINEIHGGMKTIVVTEKTTSNLEPPNSLKATTLNLLKTAGDVNNTVSISTNNHILLFSKQTVSKRGSSTAHKNVTSSIMTTGTRSTAPVGPTLAPKPSPAALGTYSVSNGTADCIKATMCLTMIVKNKNINNLEYFNIDPNTTQTTGLCGPWLSTLQISFEGGFIRFSFTKDREVYYLSVVEAALEILSEVSRHACHMTTETSAEADSAGSSASKQRLALNPRVGYDRLSSKGNLYLYSVTQRMDTVKGSLESLDYSGMTSNELFSAPLGNSFKCSSKQTMNLADDMQLLLVDSQLQAFDIVGNQFGKGDVCALDRNKKIIPAAVSLSLAGLIIILLITCVIYRRKTETGYSRI